MPAKSEKQKTAANIAHAIKKGYIKPKAGTASAEMAKGMTDTQIGHFRKENIDEVVGDGSPATYQDALAKMAQAITSNNGDVSVFDVYTTLALLFGKRLKHVQQELDEKIEEYTKNKNTDSMKQENFKIEQGHIKLSEIINKLIEGDTSKQEEPSSQQQKNRFEWENDPYHSRRFEKSDVSWREYDMDMNPQNYRVKEGEEEKMRFPGDAYDREEKAERGEKGNYSGYSNKPKMAGITFFNVPSGKEAVAKQYGLTQFKSGKWGYKHRVDPQVISVASDREKSAVSAAERVLGKGRYWEPKN